MKFNQRRLILGADWPDDERGTILGRPGMDILRWVWPDGWPRKIGISNISDHAR